MALLSGALSDVEVREGIKSFCIQLSDGDLDLLSLYLQDKGANGELTLAMFMDLVRASEMELPKPSKGPVIRSHCHRFTPSSDDLH